MKQDVLTFDDDLVLNSVVVKPRATKNLYTEAVDGQIICDSLIIGEDNIIDLISTSSGGGGVTQDDLELKQDSLGITSNITVRSLKATTSSFGSALLDGGQISCDSLIVDGTNIIDLIASSSSGGDSKQDAITTSTYSLTTFQTSELKKFMYLIIEQYTSPSYQPQTSSNLTSAKAYFFDNSQSLPGGVNNTQASVNNIAKWDLTIITDISLLFLYLSNFNEDISAWNVSTVKNMVGVFINCSSFNQDLSNWSVGSVNNMQFMFANCTSLIRT